MQSAQYSFVFANVHKRNQFAELLNLQRYRQISRSTAFFGEESKEEPLSDATIIRNNTWASIKYYAMKPDNDSSLWFVSSNTWSDQNYIEIMD